MCPQKSALISLTQQEVGSGDGTPKQCNGVKLRPHSAAPREDKRIEQNQIVWWFGLEVLAFLRRAVRQGNVGTRLISAV